MQTTHQIHFGLAQSMSALADQSVDLVVTSPPYPMVEMWDESMATQNSEIRGALARQDGAKAFALMHSELDKVWDEVCRVTKPSAFVCINIGDATRTINGEFQLYSNHSRILHYFLQKEFCSLPPIIWRKPTNAPNKFMGSGMLPAGAYVTYEHEYILILRKGGKRLFKTEAEKLRRQQSAFFWEERNQWFSDLWEIRGTVQKMISKATRERSGAYPFDIPYRLINMYSVKGDIVLDPFLGTGTTALAALAAGRNSVGYELDLSLDASVRETLSSDKLPFLNNVIQDRLQHHREFVEKREAIGNWEIKHLNVHYGFPVMTGQEVDLLINYVSAINESDQGVTAFYSTQPDKLDIQSYTVKTRAGQQVLTF